MAAPTNPHILSVATSWPRYRIGQDEARDFAQAMFKEAIANLSRILRIFENVGVEGRNFCVPLEWFYENHTFSEKNNLYQKHALGLSETAARRALEKAGACPEDIGAIFFVSTTGLSTPSLDSKLIGRLGLPPTTRRAASFGHGCAAGAGGLAQAAFRARHAPTPLIHWCS